MARNIRNMRAQLNYVISQNAHIGESKRAYMLQHDGKTDGKTFSISYTKNLRECANAFAQYIKEEHPEVKMAKDITSEIAQGWLDKNKDNWSNVTMINRISQLKMIATQINNTYKSANVQFDIHNSKDSVITRRENVAMERQDYEKIRNFLANSASQAVIAIELAGRCGLRVKEISFLKTENIDLEKNVLHINEGAMYGKHRIVPIRVKDRKYFSDLKDALEYQKQKYVCNGVKEDSLNRPIREAMKKIGINNKYAETVNAIRKMYARERMQEERMKKYSEREAWSIVQRELGHDSRFRQHIYDAYMK